MVWYKCTLRFPSCFATEANQWCETPNAPITIQQLIPFWWFYIAMENGPEWPMYRLVIYKEWQFPWFPPASQRKNGAPRWNLRSPLQCRLPCGDPHFQQAMRWLHEEVKPGAGAVARPQWNDGSEFSKNISLKGSVINGNDPKTLICRLGLWSVFMCSKFFWSNMIQQSR